MTSSWIKSLISETIGPQWNAPASTTQVPRLAPFPEPLSCYALPAFWEGARRVREEPELVVTRALETSEAAAGRATVVTQLVERTTYVPADEERRARSERQLKNLVTLKNAAGKRDLLTMRAYHDWLGQGSAPVGAEVEEEG